MAREMVLFTIYSVLTEGEQSSFALQRSRSAQGWWLLLHSGPEMLSKSRLGEPDM